jgi:hypothetical protein
MIPGVAFHLQRSMLLAEIKRHKSIWIGQILTGFQTG